MKTKIPSLWIQKILSASFVYLAIVHRKSTGLSVDWNNCDAHLKCPTHQKSLKLWDGTSYEPEGSDQSNSSEEEEKTDENLKYFEEQENNKTSSFLIPY